VQKGLRLAIVLVRVQTQGCFAPGLPAITQTLLVNKHLSFSVPFLVVLKAFLLLSSVPGQDYSCLSYSSKFMNRKVHTVARSGVWTMDI
jgi:hypothetical protein